MVGRRRTCKRRVKEAEEKQRGDTTGLFSTKAIKKSKGRVHEPRIPIALVIGPRKERRWEWS